MKKFKIKCDYCGEREIELNIGDKLFYSLEEQEYISYHFKDPILNIEIRICSICLKKALDTVMKKKHIKGGEFECSTS